MPIERRPRRGRIIIGLLAAVSLAVPATAAAGLKTGFADRLYENSNPKVRGRWLQATSAASSQIARLNVTWSSLAPSKPSHPGDPADHSYNFGTLDAAVRSAAGHHLTVLLTVYSAPSWAEARHPPSSVSPGTWRPKAGAFGHLGHALAKRYSGHYNPAGAGGPLPRVRFYEAWNEPNLSAYITPQYRGKHQTSAGIYRKLLNAFYGGVKSAKRGDKVVSGGLAPYGEDPGGDRTRPLIFLRKLLCLHGKTASLHAGKCPDKAHMDIVGDHPIDTSGGPNRSAINPNDVATPDFKNLRKTVRAAESRHVVKPGGHRPLWATEIWWESNPPDHAEGVSTMKQARYLEVAMQLLARQGASAVINLQIRDEARTINPGSTATGVFFANGVDKPSFTAWRFPFVITSRHGNHAKVWTRSPAPGRMRFQKRAGGQWKDVASQRVHTGEIVRRNLPVSHGQAVRGRIRLLSSLPFG